MRDSNKYKLLALIIGFSPVVHFWITENSAAWENLDMAKIFGLVIFSMGVVIRKLEEMNGE